jgi:hypothetical protein
MKHIKTYKIFEARLVVGEAVAISELSDKIKAWVGI